MQASLYRDGCAPSREIRPGCGQMGFEMQRPTRPFGATSLPLLLLSARSPETEGSRIGPGRRLSEGTCT